MSSNLDRYSSRSRTITRFAAWLALALAPLMLASAAYLVSHPPYLRGLSTIVVSLLVCAWTASRTHENLADESASALRRCLKPVAYALYAAAAICAVAGLVSILRR